MRAKTFSMYAMPVRAQRRPRIEKAGPIKVTRFDADGNVVLEGKINADKPKFYATGPQWEPEITPKIEPALAE